MDSINCDDKSGCTPSSVEPDQSVLNGRSVDEKRPEKNQSSSKKPRKQKRKLYRDYWCKVCDRHFRNKNHYEVHERIHTGERPFQCTVCNMAFRKSSHLTEHKRRHLGVVNQRDIKGHVCSDCKRVFTTKTGLRRHTVTHYSTAPKYSCSHCERKFVHKSTYRRHLLVESGNKTFACDFCEMKFYDRSDMRKHLSVHIGFKKFVCTECGKRFVQSGGLKSHKCEMSSKKQKQGKFIDYNTWKNYLEVEDSEFNLSNRNTTKNQARLKTAVKLPPKRKVCEKKEFGSTGHKKSAKSNEKACSNQNEDVYFDKKLTAVVDLISDDESDVNDIADSESEDSNSEEDGFYIDSVVDDNASEGENKYVGTTVSNASPNFHQEGSINTAGTDSNNSNESPNKDVRKVKELLVTEDVSETTASTDSSTARDKEWNENVCIYDIIANDADVPGLKTNVPKSILAESDAVKLSVSKLKSTNTVYSLDSKSEYEVIDDEVELFDREVDEESDIIEADLELEERNKLSDFINNKSTKENNGSQMVPALQVPPYNCNFKSIKEAVIQSAKTNELIKVAEQDEATVITKKLMPQIQLVCRHCEMKFVARREYLQHLKDKHFQLQCDKCGLKMKWRNFDEHKCQVCELCSKVFDSYKSLKKHKEKTHMCKACNKIFCTMVNLKNHEKNEMCRLIFSCQQCKKIFPSQNTLEKHEKIHARHKNKYFQCEICGNGYDEMYHLKKHYMMHEGKFICLYCKRKCYDKHVLRKHQRNCAKSFNAGACTTTDTVVKESILYTGNETSSIVKSCTLPVNNITDVSGVILMDVIAETTSGQNSGVEEDLDLPDIDDSSADDDDDKFVAMNKSFSVIDEIPEGTTDLTDESETASDIEMVNPGENDYADVENDSFMIQGTKTESTPVAVDSNVKLETGCCNDNIDKTANKNRLLTISNDLFGKKTFPLKKHDHLDAKSISNDSDKSEEDTSYGSESVHEVANTSRKKRKLSMLTASSMKDSKLQLKSVAEKEYENQNVTLDNELVRNAKDLYDRKFETGENSIDYKKNSGKSRYDENSMRATPSDIVNICQVNNVSGNRNQISAHAQETMSSIESESDYDSDTDSDGYEECTAEEVKAMLLTIRS